MVGPGREELASAMGSSSVVIGLARGQGGPQMPLAEDQYPVGDLGPGGEHEPFGVSVRAPAAGRDLHGLDPSVGQDSVKRCGELPGPVPDHEPGSRRRDHRGPSGGCGSVARSRDRPGSR